MKVAVITPYYKESMEILTKCHKSVLLQTYKNIDHIMVADGSPRIGVTWPDVKHMILPFNHSDAGATPRALAAMSAFTVGYDSVAFLDCDNTYDRNHIATVVNTMDNSQSDVVVASRNICDKFGKFLYVDRIESNGDTFCDTNCLFIKKTTMSFLPNWITSPDLQLWSDRVFWSAIRSQNLKISVSIRPTVNYNSRWAWHYQHAGLQPPDDSVWIDQSSEGALRHITHKSIKE